MRDFFSAIFELLGSLRGNASDDLYEFIYVPAGFLLLGLTFVMVYVWYFALFPKQAKFNTLRDWAIWGGGTTVLVTLVITLFTVGKLERENLEYIPLDYIEFIVLAFVWTIILYFLYSIAVKNFSPTKRRVPF